jgi:hypothetical protein
MDAQSRYRKIPFSIAACVLFGDTGWGFLSIILFSFMNLVSKWDSTHVVAGRATPEFMEMLYLGMISIVLIYTVVLVLRQCPKLGILRRGDLAIGDVVSSSKITSSRNGVSYIVRVQFTSSNGTLASAVIETDTPTYAWKALADGLEHDIIMTYGDHRTTADGESLSPLQEEVCYLPDHPYRAITISELGSGVVVTSERVLDREPLEILKCLFLPLLAIVTAVPAVMQALAQLLPHR